MRNPLVIAWAIIVFILWSPAHAIATSGFLYTVKGRVVDERGRPVPDVTVALKSPQYPEGDIVYLNSSDAGGRFLIQKNSQKPIFNWKLWVSDSTRLPDSTDEMLGWNTTFCSEYYKSLCGKTVQLLPNRINDLGDIKLEVIQYPLLVHFSDPLGKPLIQKRNVSDNGFDAWWRVRDPLGDIIAEGSNAFVHFRFEESAVMIALPAGKWTLEISDDDGSGMGGSFDVEVSPSQTVKDIYLKLGEYESTASYSGRIHYSEDGREEAKRQIRSRGFNVSESAFQRRVVLGNDKIVELFLRAGFDPNVLTKNQELLMSAIDRPRVLKLLLAAGADVNRHTDRGITPLLQAVGWLVIPTATVKMLLDAGADINARADGGRDVFTLSEDRPEVRALLNEYKLKHH
jgi:hypothetical protein